MKTSFPASLDKNLFHEPIRDNSIYWNFTTIFPIQAPLHRKMPG